MSTAQSAAKNVRQVTYRTELAEELRSAADHVGDRKIKSVMERSAAWIDEMFSELEKLKSQLENVKVCL